MPRFAYTARDRSGKSVADAVEAPSRRDALRLLAARGLQVAAVNETAGGSTTAKKGKPAATVAGTKPKRSALFAQRGIVPTKNERLPMLQSLHDLTSSGLSAGESVRLLSQRIKEPALRSLCAGLWEKLSEGSPLSRAMADFPDVFDSGTVNLIQAGEATGSLNETLSRIITHLKEQRALRQQLLAAMAYPSLLTLVAAGVITFFLTFLLPRLQTLLDSLHGKMPVSTQILIGLSHFALHYGVLVLGALVIAGVSFWRWRATEAGRRTTDAWALKLPLLGTFSIAQTVLAFSQTLSVLLENGITAAEALRMTERQISNRVHREAFNVATARVLEGEALSVALQRTGCFPDLVLDRLAIGENTGNIVPSLKDVAANYRQIISQQLNFFTRVIAGVILMAVFVFVGFIAFAMVSAVFQLSASFKMS
jgi:type II secretory pathway component PulF